MAEAIGAGPSQDRVRMFGSPIVRRMWNLRLEGFDNIPQSGPAILCPNHISFLDSAFLMLTRAPSHQLRRQGRVHGLVEDEVPLPGARHDPHRPRRRGQEHRRPRRGRGRAARGASCSGIFPEGTRSRDGYLYKGHTGAARLALKIGCPILPVGIVGTDEIQPPDAKLPKPFR